MTIDLIPILEIQITNQGIPAPDQFPFWDHPQIWNCYHAECYAKAGYNGKWQPYLDGAGFILLAEISEDNLTKLVMHHTQELREGEYRRDDVSTLFGGYVLRVDGQDKYFPQCCGALGDIAYWESMSNGIGEYCEGHPAPLLTFDEDLITLDFSVRECDESFQPPLKETQLTIHRSMLKLAVTKVKDELHKFEQRLVQINLTHQFNIENIGNLLLYGEIH